MEKIALKVVIRKDKPKKMRGEGFIPGVLSGPGTASVSMQFESGGLNKVITRHGTSAKLRVMLDGKKEFGFLEEVQRHPVDGNAVHVSVQMISEDQNMKMQLPIVFRGHGELEHNLLQPQVYYSEVEVEGKATLVSDEIVTEVSDKKAGEATTVADFYLPAEVRLITPGGEIYAAIEPVRTIVTDADEETQTAADEVVNQSWSEKIDSPLFF